MSDPMDIDLMTDVLDLLGRLSYVQLVTVIAVTYRLMPPAKRQAPSFSPRREKQAARIQAHVERLRATDRAAYERLEALLGVIGNE